MTDVIRLGEDRLPELLQIERACFSNPWSAQSLSAALRDPDTVVVGTTDSAGRLIGYGALKRVLDDGYILNVGVLPAYRRQGAGAALVSALLAFAKTQRLAFVTLEVRRSNAAAIALYQKFGFAAQGIRKNYYSRPVEDALLMTCRAPFSADDATDDLQIKENADA